MKYLIILLFALAFLTSITHAQSTVVIPGSRPGTASGLYSYSNGNSSVFLSAAQDHSIYCRYRSEATVDLNFSTNIICANVNCPITGTLVGDIEGGIDFDPAANDAITFIAPFTEKFEITLASILPNPSSLIIECFNTTLFGNFNTVTAANPFNFLELSNDTNLPATVLIVVTSNSGVELSRFNATIPALQQRDVSIHDLPGAANTFGRILVSHNSIPNGVRGNLSKYRIDGSSLVITASSPLITRLNAL